MKKYTSISEKEKPENKEKIVISDDAFAICDYIEQLIMKLENISQKYGR